MPHMISIKNVTTRIFKLVDKIKDITLLLLLMGLFRILNSTLIPHTRSLAHLLSHLTKQQLQIILITIISK